MVKGKSVKFLFLSEEDMIEAGVLDMGQCVETMVEMFDLMGKGDYLLGGASRNSHGIKIEFPETSEFPNMPVLGPDRRFMAMVGYLGGKFNVCGEKWYGSHIINPSRGLPRSILNIILNDPDTSEPLAFMSGNLVSAMRTGAIPGVGARYLARPDSKVAGIVAAGVISKASLMSLAYVLKDLEEVKVFDLNQERAASFCEEMSKELGLNVHPVGSLEECVVGSDVINVAASGKASPHIKPEWVKEGAYLALPAGVSFEPDYLLNVPEKVVVDHWKMHMAFREELKGLDIEKHFGLASKYLFKYIKDGKMKDDDVVSLGDIISGKKPGRENSRERTVCITGGLPTEDLAWSFTVYQNALKKGIGQELKLWNEPHWF